MRRYVDRALMHAHVQRQGQPIPAEKPSAVGKTGGHWLQEPRCDPGLDGRSSAVPDPDCCFPGKPRVDGALRLAIPVYLQLESG